MSTTRQISRLAQVPASWFLCHVLAACGGGPRGAPAAPDPIAARVGPGFVSHEVDLHGTTIRYVRGGHGPAVILLHGYPQDWSEWRHVMPALALDFTVIAIDLRGIGGSAAPPSGYDAATMAADVHALAVRLELDGVYLVGHDIGGMVAYAYARQFATQARGVMIVDVPLPGVEPWTALENRPRAWHWQFHQRLGLPELLVAGRQADYFRDLVNRFARHPDRISDGDIADYATAYGPPASLHAGFEMYRAFPTNGEFNQAHRDALELPLVLVGGEHSGAPLFPAMAASLKVLGCSHVEVESVADSGHFVANEQPDALVAIIRHHAARVPK